MDQNQPGYQKLSLHTQTNHLLELPFYYSVAKAPAKAYEWARWHEEIEIKFILDGKAEITCGPRVFLAEEGDLVVVNSCELHSIRPYGEKLPVYDLLMLSPQALYSASIGGLLEPVIRGEVRFQNLIRGDERVRAVMEQLFQELREKKTGYELGVTGYVSVLLSCLMRNYLQSDLPQTLFPDVQKHIEKLRPAIAYIQDHYFEEMKTQTLAGLCGLSLYHFCRLFKQVTGYTVVTYVNQLRIHKAKLLLASTDIPIAGIAEAVGYSDPAYFSRCFKKHTGCAPATFRNSAK